MEGYKLIAEGILGWVVQWFMFGPKKVPNVLAWGCILGLGTALWIWMTPDAGTQWAMNWRAATGSLLTFLAASKGFGAFGKAIGIAPATDSK